MRNIYTKRNGMLSTYFYLMLIFVTAFSSKLFSADFSLETPAISYSIPLSQPMCALAPHLSELIDTNKQSSINQNNITITFTDNVFHGDEYEQYGKYFSYFLIKIFQMYRHLQESDNPFTMKSVNFTKEEIKEDTQLQLERCVPMLILSNFFMIPALEKYFARKCAYQIQQNKLFIKEIPSHLQQVVANAYYQEFHKVLSYTFYDSFNKETKTIELKPSLSLYDIILQLKQGTLNRKRKSTISLSQKAGILRFQLLTSLNSVEHSISETITSLDLSHNKLACLSEEFSKLSQLRHLNLSFNNFSTLTPYRLPLPPSVEFLNLRNNSISYIDPKTFDNMPPHLQTLKLANNKLTEIPTTISHLPVTKLMIKNNMLRTLPNLPKQCITLNTENNPLDKQKNNPFPLEGTLKNLSISHQGMTQLLPKSQEQLKKLQLLTIYGKVKSKDKRHLKKCLPAITIHYKK